MAEFQDAQQRLFQARTAYGQAARSLFLAAEQLKQVASEMEALERWASPGNAQSMEQRRSLEARRRRLESLEKEHQQRLDAIKGELAGVSGVFQEAWSDPRRQMEKLDDGFPVMLFPLRLETRFKTLKHRRSRMGLPVSRSSSSGCASTRTSAWWIRSRKRYRKPNSTAARSSGANIFMPREMRRRNAPPGVPWLPATGRDAQPGSRNSSARSILSAR